MTLPVLSKPAPNWRNHLLRFTAYALAYLLVLTVTSALAGWAVGCRPCPAQSPSPSRR